MPTGKNGMAGTVLLDDHPIRLVIDKHGIQRAAPGGFEVQIEFFRICSVGQPHTEDFSHFRYFNAVRFGFRGYFVFHSFGD
jgi:hypothetical protein